MEPSISDGQLVVIWKLAYGIPMPASNRYLWRWRMPQAGDVVLYRMEGRYVVKRCVKTEGEPLRFIVNPPGLSKDYGALKLESGTVPLTGVQFGNIGGFLPEDAQKIPAGFILALGDNAEHSRDSRDYGFVAAGSIRGKLLWN